MISKRSLVILVAMTLLFVQAGAQSNQEKARALLKRAVELEDEQKYDDALPLLSDAEVLDPKNYVYEYEIGYCYRGKKDYKNAEQALQKVMAFPDAKAECYQMLGDIYDLDGDSTMALRTYANGIRKFPDAGRLYLETGNVYLIRKQYNKALPWYEKGIALDPAYPSNYYRAAQLFLSSSESVWGMIYGEIFMNLERGTDRTADMSKWIFDNYKSRVTVYSKDSVAVNFSSNNIEAVAEDSTLPFSASYEMTLLLGFVQCPSNEYDSLCKVRKTFIDSYYEQHLDKEHPNVLFAYERQIEKAGFLDAYNHWVLMSGDEGKFLAWQKKHQKEWDNFTAWFKDHSIQLTADNVFVREKA